MKQIIIISVGKKSSEPIRQLIGEYQKRLETNLKVRWQFIPPLAGKMSPDEQVQKESELIVSKLGKDHFVVLLDERGQLFDNFGLADAFKDWFANDDTVVFVIGGAYGVSQQLRSSSDLIWSLSSLVFPHEIARLLLIEQLYRCQAILANSPYHHV